MELRGKNYYIKLQNLKNIGQKTCNFSRLTGGPVLLSCTENLKEKTKDLFRTPLNEMINLKHSLVILSKNVSWDDLEEELSGLYELENDRPGKPIRLMVSLYYLKYTYSEKGRLSPRFIR